MNSLIFCEQSTTEERSDILEMMFWKKSVRYMKIFTVGLM